jgi:pimeloyl-ACP methyl ester carboxylesterase
MQSNSAYESQKHPIRAPVIFLPGTLCDERIWMPLWHELNLEQRAYVPLQWADSLANMLALTTDRITSFNEPIHLVGFSMGGYIASLAALLKPEQVKSITLIGFDPFGLSPQELSARKFILKNIKTNKADTAQMNTARFAQYFTEQEIQKTEYTQTIVDMSNDLGMATLAAHIGATTPRDDLTSKLAKLPLPQHFIVGQHDKIAPIANIRRYTDKNKQARLTELSNTAHITPLTKTNEIADLLHQTLR